jgi:hypothetical protein
MATTVTSRMCSHRTSSRNAMVVTLCAFLAASLRCNSAGLSSSSLLSRSTDRGISKAGEPSRPTPSRISPSIGTMTFVASRQLSPVRPWAG